MLNYNLRWENIVFLSLLLFFMGKVKGCICEPHGRVNTGPTNDAIAPIRYLTSQ